MLAIDVYKGSDGELTKRYYAELEKCGPIGLVALHLFRAQKASERAKLYRGGVRGQGSFRSMAYDKKTWSMQNLCKALAQHGDALGIRYGWKEDLNTVFDNRASWVLYVDLPQGQVSFHSPSRGIGPNYPGDWDGQRGMSVQRIVDFCESLFARSQAVA